MSGILADSLFEIMIADKLIYTTFCDLLKLEKNTVGLPKLVIDPHGHNLLIAKLQYS